jgi:tetratricopeptide (TPR) repeat protein
MRRIQKAPPSLQTSRLLSESRIVVPAFRKREPVHLRSTGKISSLVTIRQPQGNWDRGHNRMDEARKDYDEALKIRRELAQKNPDTYLPDVAVTLNNLGYLLSNQNRMDEARKAYDEALGIYQRFAARDPARFAKDVTRVKDLIEKLSTAH